MQQEKNYQNKFLNKYSEKYGMSPSGYYLFLLDELDSDEKNIIELNNILKKLGIEFTLEDHKNSSEKKYRTLGIKIDFDTIEKFETRGAGKKKAIAKNNITVGELKELKKTKTNDEIIAQLGCSRASFYRAYKRLKDHESYMPDIDATYFL
nr:unnamed protein product [uncultured bacterium]